MWLMRLAFLLLLYTVFCIIAAFFTVAPTSPAPAAPKEWSHIGIGSVQLHYNMG